MKCKYNTKLKKRVCKRDFFSRNNDGGVTQENKNVRYLAIITMVILSFIAVINISDWETIKPLFISLIFLTFGIIIYSLREYQDDLIGFRLKDIPINLIYAAVFAGGFIVTSYFVPFFSLAYPRYPQAIGEGLRGFLINFISPTTETIFFQACIFAFLINFMSKDGLSSKEKYSAIILTSLAFAFFHLSAYIFGFASLDLPQATTAFLANISAFMTAFVFSAVALTFAFRNGVSKASATGVFLFILFFHAFLNIASYYLSVVKFV